MFDKAQRKFDPPKVPGPGQYFMEGKFKPDTQRSQYTIPRATRVLPFDKTKPDYDMSVFYEDKGPSIKPKMGGYTISNTGGADSVVDPSKQAGPGVGNYAWTHSHEKTTFTKSAPKFSVPTAGHLSIEAILASTSNNTNVQDMKDKL